MNKWLKIGAVVVVALLGVVAITGIVLAQGPVGTDGTCDTCGAELGQGFGRGRQVNPDGDIQGRWWNDGEAPYESWVDEDGDGVCDNFVDEDGDGVCDLCGAELGEQMMYGWRFSSDSDVQGQARGWNENGEALCDDFVDEDGDGVCDNHDDEALGAGYGARGGRMGGRMGGRTSLGSNGQ